MLSYLNEMLGFFAEERCWDAVEKLPHCSSGALPPIGA